MKRIGGIFSVFLLSWQLSAQVGWEAGPWGGISYYFGDLNTNFDLGLPGPAAGFALRYSFNERICMRAGLNVGSISADDARSKNNFERARNLSFQSALTDGTLQLEFNFLPYIHGHRDYFFTPYMLGGFAYSRFNPKAEFDGRLVELRPLGTEGQLRGEEYYIGSFGWLYGGGFKLDLNYRFSLNLEIAARGLSTDYLDDVSSVYADKRDLQRLRGDIAVALSDRSIPIPGVEGSQLGRPGVQRGDRNSNDTYVYLGLGILYYFGDLKCPDANYRRRLR